MAKYRMPPMVSLPKPPEDAVRFEGDPRYQRGGYVLDGKVEGRPARWRYDERGLIAYILYEPLEVVWARKEKCK